MTKRLAKKNAKRLARLIEERHQFVVASGIQNPALLRKETKMWEMYYSIFKLLRKNYWNWVKLRARSMKYHGEIYGTMNYGKWFPKNFTMSYRKNSENIFDLDTMRWLGHPEEEVQAVADSMGW